MGSKFGAVVRQSLVADFLSLDQKRYNQKLKTRNQKPEIYCPGSFQNSFYFSWPGGAVSRDGERYL